MSTSFSLDRQTETDGRDHQVSLSRLWCTSVTMKSLPSMREDFVARTSYHKWAMSVVMTSQETSSSRRWRRVDVLVGSFSHQGLLFRVRSVHLYTSIKFNTKQLRTRTSCPRRHASLFAGTISAISEHWAKSLRLKKEADHIDSLLSESLR